MTSRSLKWMHLQNNVGTTNQPATNTAEANKLMEVQQPSVNNNAISQQQPPHPPKSNSNSLTPSPTMQRPPIRPPVASDPAHPHPLTIDPPAGDKKGAKNDNKQPESGSKCFKWVRTNLLLFLTIIAVILGLMLGTLLRTMNLHEDTIDLIAFPGQILTRLLKMLILPLIVSSLISGLSQQNASTSSKMGVIALVYYMATTVLAAILGIILVLSIHPGNPDTAIERRGDVLGDSPITTRDSVLDLLRNLFPENLVQSCFEQQKTVYKPRKKPTLTMTTPQPMTQQTPLFYNSFNQPSSPKVPHENASSNGSALLVTMAPAVADAPQFKRVIEYTAGTNVLGLIAFCICFGICLSSMGNKRAHVMIEFFFELNEAVMKLISVIMWYSPVGIMFLISSNMASIQSPGELIAQLGMYMITVLAGLFIHGLVSLPLLYFIFTRKNPYRLVRGVLQAIITALGTSSSAATLPITFRCLEKNLGIDSRVCRFVLPIGATVNMDGTALYEAVAPIFIAQMRNRQLTMYQIIVVSITATLASIGAAAIPSAGLVTMVIVLTSIDLPTDDIYLIWAVDWLLDRFRTSINVLGDCYGTAIVAHLSAGELKRQDMLFAQRTQQEAETSLRQIQRELSNFSEGKSIAGMAAIAHNVGMTFRRASLYRDSSPVACKLRLAASSVDRVRTGSLSRGKPDQADRQISLNKSKSDARPEWV